MKDIESPAALTSPGEKTDQAAGSSLERACSASPEVGAGEELAWLERLLQNCPGAIIKYNDDPDVEDELGMVPIGFSIRMDGCAGLWSVAGPTLSAAIRADMEESERELRRQGGTAETQNVEADRLDEAKPS